MPAMNQKEQKPKHVHFNDDTFDWLMAATMPVPVKVGLAPLDIYGYNEAMRHIQSLIQHKRCNP